MERETRKRMVKIGVTVTQEQKQWLNRMVNDGVYFSVSYAVRQALQLLQRHVETEYKL